MEECNIYGYTFPKLNLRERAWINLGKHSSKGESSLALKQYELAKRIGMSRQQLQKIESQGNPSLSTLELIASGLNCRLMLIPREHLHAITEVLAPF